MPEPIEEIKTALATAAQEAKDARAVQSTEIKSAVATAEEAKTALVAANQTIEKLDAKLIEVEKEQKRMAKPVETFVAKSIGEIFVKSDVFESIQSSGRGSSSPVHMKDITSGGASAGALVRPDRDTTVYMNPNRPTRIRDLVSTVPTASNAVEVMRENVFTNNADMQAGELATKAQSEITYELVTYPVRTPAHWIPASRQVLSDAPMLRGLIDNRLVYGLDLVSDAQLLQGSGTGNDVTGLLVDTDVSTVGQIPAGPSTAAEIAAAMIDHIRKAVTQCQLFEYYNVNGIVLNPQDWETLETAKATDGHYLMISMPQDGSAERIWRMPVVITNAMPVSNFLLGDWTMGATLYDREDVSVRVSESHADYFVKNGVVILGEERYAFAIQLPKAFCKGLFTVAA